MSSVDNRIVNLKMNASQFTQAAQSAIGSLKTLEEKLRLSGAGKGIQTIAEKAKDLNFNPAINSVESLTGKFSVMEIAGIRAVQNITDRLMNMAIKFGKEITIDPVMDGFKEYETKMQSIQTILTNTASKGTTLDDVNKALEELNEYSDKTIYNFAQMTENIGKATAAGVGLEDGVTFVKGMANLAAGFGVDKNSMAGATQQMTQALASGVIRLQDWISLENRGMSGEMFQNALLDTAAEMGVYVDVSKGFRYTLEQNWLTSDIFMKTMEKMANDKSLIRAATEVTSFTKLIDTMKESVGSGWAVTWEHILGNKEEATELFTGINNAFTDLIDPMINYRNESLKAWKVEGGRAALLQGLANIGESLSGVFTRIWMAFKSVIDPYNSDRLVAMSKAFLNFTEKIKLSGSALRNIRRAFGGVFSIFKLIGMILKPIGALFGKLVGATGNAMDTIALFAGTIGGAITSVVNWIEKIGVLQLATEAFAWVGEKLADGIGLAWKKMFNFITSNLWLVEEVTEHATKYIKLAYEEISKWITKAIEFASPYVTSFVEDTLKPFAADTEEGLLTVAEAAHSYLVNDMPKHWDEFVSKVKDKVADFKDAMIEFNNTYKPIEKVRDFTRNALEDIGNAFTFVWGVLKQVGGKISDILGGVWDSVMGADIQGIDIFNAGLFGLLIIGIKKVLQFGKAFIEGFSGFKTAGVEALEAVRDVAESYQKTLKSNVLLKIAIALGLLAAAIIVLSTVDPKSLAIAATAMGVSLFAIIKIVKNINDDLDSFKDTAKLQSAMTAMVKIGFAMYLFASAIKKLDGMSWDEMLIAVTGLGAIMGAVIGTFKLLEKVKINENAFATLSKIGFGLMSIAGAFALIGLLSWGSIIKGVTTMTICLAEIIIMLKVLDGVKNINQSANSILPIAKAMLVLAAAFWALSLLDAGQILGGLGVMAAVMTELGVFMKVVNGANGGMMMDAGAGLVKIAGSLIIFAAAFWLLSKLDPMAIIGGLLTMAGALAIFAAATVYMKGTNAVPIATGMLILGAAMIVFAMAFKKFQDLSWSDIAKGIVGMVAALLVLGGAAAILAPLSAALIPVALGMLGLAGACLLLGIALPMLSTGLVALGVAFTTSAVGIMGGILMISAALPVLLSSLGVGLALALASFITTLAYSAPALERALTDLINMILQVLINCMPKLEELISQIIVALCDAIIKGVPKLFEVITTVIQEIAKFITTNLPTVCDLIVTMLYELIDLVVEVVVGGILRLITSIIDELAEGIPAIMNSVGNMVDKICEAVGENIPKLVNAAYDMVISIINGLAEAVETKGPQLRNAVFRLVRAILDEIGSWIGDFVSIGGDIVGGIAQGIWDHISAIGEAASGIARKAWDVVCDLLGIASPSKEFMKVGRFCDEGMAIGLSKYSDLVAKEAMGVGKDALNSMNDAMSRVGEVLGSDVSDQPVIRPILDLSEIQNGAGTINDMLGGSRSVGANLAGQISARMANSTSTEDRMISAIKDLKDSLNVGSGDTYTINGVTYDDGSNIATAVKDIVRAAKIGRRV